MVYDAVLCVLIVDLLWVFDKMCEMNIYDVACFIIISSSSPFNF